MVQPFGVLSTVGGWLSSGVDWLLGMDQIAQGVSEGFAEAFADDLWEHQLLGGRPRFSDRLLSNYGSEVGQYEARLATGRPDYRRIARVDTRHPTPQALKAVDDAVYGGGKFMWTLDERDVLSVAVLDIATHGVLAEGFDVWAAGQGEPDVPAQWEQYKEREILSALAQWYERSGDVGRATDLRQHLARQPRISRPPAIRAKCVILDFKSGHYHPTRAWRETLEGWQRVGYAVEKKKGSFTT